MTRVFLSASSISLPKVGTGEDGSEEREKYQLQVVNEDEMRRADGLTKDAE